MLRRPLISRTPWLDEIARRAAAKWRAVLARIDSEGEMLAACRASPDACSPAARRLLQLLSLVANARAAFDIGL